MRTGGQEEIAHESRRRPSSRSTGTVRSWSCVAVSSLVRRGLAESTHESRLYTLKRWAHAAVAVFFTSPTIIDMMCNAK